MSVRMHFGPYLLRQRRLGTGAMASQVARGT